MTNLSQKNNYKNNCFYSFFLIKIIVEHNLAFSEYTDVNEIIEAVEEGMDSTANSRWYDIDRTVRAAINMLENTPPDTQKIIAKEMAKIVIDKIKEDKDIEELKRELEQEGLFDDSDESLEESSLCPSVKFGILNLLKLIKIYSLLAVVIVYLQSCFLIEILILLIKLIIF